MICKFSFCSSKRVNLNQQSAFLNLYLHAKYWCNSSVYSNTQSILDSHNMDSDTHF